MYKNKKIDLLKVKENEEYEVISKVLDALVINNVADEDEPPTLFDINGVGVLSQKSIAVVKAEKKSGKSNFAGVLMAACISEDGDVLDGVVKRNIENIKVLYIDTEQPLRDARRSLRRMMKTAGYDGSENWNDHDIVAVSVKDYDEEDRSKLIEVAIIKYSPQLVIVDGIADLLPSINDEVESRELMKTLDRWSCSYNCVVLGILHLNYNSSKMSGWLGTMAGKKFTDSFSLKKDKSAGTFEVEHEGRGKPAPKFSFRIVNDDDDETGEYELVGKSANFMVRMANEKKELTKFFEKAPLPCQYNDLVKWVMDEKGWISDSPAKKELKKGKDYGILENRKEGRRAFWSLAQTSDEQKLKSAS